METNEFLKKQKPQDSFEPLSEEEKQQLQRSKSFSVQELMEEQSDSLIDQFEDITEWENSMDNVVRSMSEGNIVIAPAEELPAQGPAYVGIDRVYTHIKRGDDSRMVAIRNSLKEYYNALADGLDVRAQLDDLIRSCKNYVSGKFRFFIGKAARQRKKEVNELMKQVKELKAQANLDKANIGEENVQQALWRVDNKSNKAIQQRIREKLRKSKLQEEDKEKLKNKKTYKVKKLTDTQQDNNTRQILGSQKILSIKDAINEVMPEAYKGMDKALTDQEAEAKELELEHAVGTKYLNQGHNVIEIDVAGSTYEQFRKEYDGYHGMNKSDKNTIGDIYDEKLDQKGYFWKKEKTSKVKVGDKEIDVTKTRYSISGPGALNVVSINYSIEKTRERIRNLGVEHLKPIFEEWKKQLNEGTEPNYQVTNFMLRGHSRGGVGASHGAMMLKYWIQTNYPEFMDYVHFDIIQYDPVPGWDVEFFEGMRDGMERYDIKSYQGVHKGEFSIDGEKMAPLEDTSGTTVVYSMVNQDDLQHKLFFAPQEVLHAKRLILMPFTHDIGLDISHIDTTQKAFDEKEKNHGMAFFDSHSGKVYRNSGLNELEDGVYVMDEHHVMIKVDTLAQLKNILMRTMPDTFVERRERILRAAASVFGDKAENNPYSTIDHKRTLNLCNAVLNDGRASTLRKNVKTELRKLREMLGDIESVNNVKTVIDQYDKVLERIGDYLKERDVGKMTKAGRRRRDQMKLLFTNLKREQGHLAYLNRLYGGKFDGSLEDAFYDGASLKRNLGTYSTINDQLGEVERIDNAGSVALFKEMSSSEAASAASVSSFAEHLGLQNYYRGASRATILQDRNNEEKSGILYEQTYDLTYNQILDKNSIYSKVSAPRFSKAAQKKLDMIKGMDLIFGIVERASGDYSSLRVQVQRHHDINTSRIAQEESLNNLRDTYEIVDVCADILQSPIFTHKGDWPITSFDMRIIKELGKETRSFIKSIKAKDLSRMLQGCGLGENKDAQKVIKKRLIGIQKLL